MIWPSLYITICSFKNRVRVRVRRLREPRYLLGAIVGGAYLYFSFFTRNRGARLSAARRAARGVPAIPPALAALVAAGPALAALALLAATVLIWIVPGTSGLLEFSEAEVQFLFPAPVTRRQLLIHRMLRSQLGLLFASVVFGIVTPSVAGFTRLRISIAMWLLLTIAKVYYAGVTLARSRLASAQTRARRVAWTPVAVLLAALAIVAAALMPVLSAPVSSTVEYLTRVSDLASRGAPSIVLWPFVTVVRPLFAAWPQPYLNAAAMSALVLAATTVWVLLSDRAFEDAAHGAVERRGSEPGPKRANYRVRAGGWSLATAGRLEAAFAWKAAMQTMRVVDPRSVARVVALLVAVTAISQSLGRGNGFAATVGLFAIVATGVALFFAPQIVRVDMRQDLQHLELMKTWPVAPSAVVRGELIWPGAMITLIAWVMLAIALIMSGTVFAAQAWGTRASNAAAIGIVAPALIFAQLTIHNGVALLFPAWVPAGGQRPRGLDAMGQRMIMLGGTWLLTALMLIPGAVGGGLVWFAARPLVGAAAVVPGALVAAVIIAIEVLLATEALGPVYERLDILAVERAE